MSCCRKSGELQKPIVGRTFTDEETVPGRNRVAVLSQSLWHSRFGSDPNISGPDSGDARNESRSVGGVEIRMKNVANRNYLTEGVSGTGKTSVCHELRSAASRRLRRRETERRGEFLITVKVDVVDAHFAASTRFTICSRDWSLISNP